MQRTENVLGVWLDPLSSGHFLMYNSHFRISWMQDHHIDLNGLYHNLALLEFLQVPCVVPILCNSTVR